MSVGKKGFIFKIADFICLCNFEWHGQNKVGNIAILVLLRDREKLYPVIYVCLLVPNSAGSDRTPLRLILC